MAEIVKTVRIETGNGERTVKSLKQEINDLRDALLNMDKEGEEWKKTADELTKAQEELNTVMKAGKQTMDADASSIAGMEARYKSLYQTYRLLSQEQRKTAEGISMQKELSELSKNLNNVKKDAGNFKDNIGHYADDMMNAFGQLGISVGSLQGPFKLATLGANGFKKALNTLAKHPILLTLTALIGILKKVSDAIKQNEELQMRWNKVVAAFKPIGDAMAFVLDKIATAAVKVAEKVAAAVTWVTNLLGITKKLSAAELEIADIENELIKKRREINELNSSDEARIQELMEEAMLEEDKVEKAKLLTEAKELQEKVNKRNVELAQKEYDLIKKQNAIRPNSTEDLDKESQAQVALNKAREDGARALRRIEKQLKSASSTGKDAADEQRKELDKILERLEENSKTEIQKLEKKYKEELALLKKYHKDSTALEKEYRENLRKLQNAELAEYNTSVMEARDRMKELIFIPSQEYFEKFYPLLQKDMDSAKKLVGEFLGLSGDTIFGYDGQAISQAFGEKYGKAISQSLDKVPEEVKHFIERFNAVFVNANTKNLQDVALYVQQLTENFLNFDKSWDIYLKDLSASTRDLEVAAQRFKDASVFYNDEDYKKNSLYLLAYLQKEYDTVEQELRNHLKELEDMEDIYLKHGFDNEQQALEFYKEMEDAKTALYNYYLETEMNLLDREKEINEQRIDAAWELKDAYVDAIGSIVDTYKTLLDAYKQDGKISEQEAKKKAKTLQWLEGIQGAAAVAGIVADTAAGWMSINKSLAAEYVLNAETAAATGPAAAATKAALDLKSNIAAGVRKATLIINGIAAASAAIGKTVASIRSLGGDSSGSETGGMAAAPQLIDSTPYSYTRELQTDVEREERLNTPIYVRVTDIESAQARVKVTENESTF